MFSFAFFIGVGDQSNFGEDVVARKLCMKNVQNARILRDICLEKLTKFPILHDI